MPTHATTCSDAGSSHSRRRRPGPIGLLLIGAGALIAIALGYLLTTLGPDEQPTIAPHAPKVAPPGPAAAPPATRSDPAPVAAAPEPLRAQRPASPPPAPEPEPANPSSANDPGLPEYWPDDVGDSFTPEGFRAMLDQALTEIRKPEEIDLIDIDCREPPCFAVLRNRRPDGRISGVQTSLAWEQAYGAAIIFMERGTTTVDCGDGRQEVPELIVPPYDLEKHADDEDMSAILAANKNRWRRVITRWREIARSWKCLDPAELRDDDATP